MARFLTAPDGSLLFHAGYHELAWSRRTSGMPLFSIYEIEGKYILKHLGYTSKAPRTYAITPIPKARFLGVLWVYWSNKGYLKITIFYMSVEETYSISLYETADFETEDPIYNADVADFIENLSTQLQINENIYNALTSCFTEPIEIPKTKIEGA